MAEPTPLIVGNWKMNGSRAGAAAFADRLGRWRAEERHGIDLVVCPPFPLVPLLVSALEPRSVSVGAQDCHAEAEGAFTGDVSPRLLAELGCSWVILGHSERRTGHGETDADIQAKARAAFAAGLNVIVCVGESLEQREAGDAEQVVARQAIASIPPEADPDRLAIAYEPLWAIGTGRSAEVDDIDLMHGDLRSRLAATRSPITAARLIYGGSVKPDNAEAILSLTEVDGVLVGGASLKAEDFIAIAAAAAS